MKMKEASIIKTNISSLLKKVENEKILRDVQALLKRNQGKNSIARSSKEHSIIFPDLQKRSDRAGKN